jgi:hypothetical protein
MSTGNENFKKYIHNSSPLPISTLTGNELHIAEFLCFAQHVQWTKTGTLAFLSDFQGMYVIYTYVYVEKYNVEKGSGELLTDPQVMTHP